MLSILRPSRTSRNIGNTKPNAFTRQPSGALMIASKFIPNGQFMGWFSPNAYIKEKFGSNEHHEWLVKQRQMSATRQRVLVLHNKITDSALICFPDEEAHFSVHCKFSPSLHECNLYLADNTSVFSVRYIPAGDVAVLYLNPDIWGFVMPPPAAAPPSAAAVANPLVSQEMSQRPALAMNRSSSVGAFRFGSGPTVMLHHPSVFRDPSPYHSPPAEETPHSSPTIHVPAFAFSPERTQPMMQDETPMLDFLTMDGLAFSTPPMHPSQYAFGSPMSPLRL